jgi:hypothetical protein
MKLKLNIFYRILFIFLIVVAYYLITFCNTNKLFVSAGYLIMTTVTIIPTYLFWKQQKSDRN